LQTISLSICNLRVGVLGQPIDALTLIVSGDAPAANTSNSQLPHVDVK